VCADRLLGDVEQQRDLLGAAALQQVTHHLALARRERFRPGQLEIRFPVRRHGLEGTHDGRDQQLAVDARLRDAGVERDHVATPNGKRLTAPTAASRRTSAKASG